MLERSIRSRWPKSLLNPICLKLNLRWESWITRSLIILRSKLLCPNKVKHNNHSSPPMWPLLWILMKRFTYLRRDRCETLKMSTVYKLFWVTHHGHEPYYHLSWILLLRIFCGPMSEFHSSTKIHQILIFFLLFSIKIFHYNQDFSTPPSQDTRNSLLPPPFINSDTTAQNMVLWSRRTFNREPLLPIPPIWPTVFPPDLNPLLNNPDQSSLYDIVQPMDRTSGRISILELIKKSRSHQEVFS